MILPMKIIQIQVSNYTRDALSVLAKRDGVSIDVKASELVSSAVKIKEDAHFARHADERLLSTKKWTTHEEVWS